MRDTEPSPALATQTGPLADRDGHRLGPVCTIAVRCNVRGSIRQIALARGSRTHSEPMPAAITGGTNGSGRSFGASDPVTWAA